MKVVWSPLAVERAVEQARYIAADKPGAARKWLAGLFAAAGRLATFPRLGRKVPELGLEDFRELDYEGYRVIYRLEARRVTVLTIRHSRRLLDPRELSEDLPR
jgi:plasmid stabilization system protein ParE